MENCDDMSGPWRATRLWNDIIRTMRAGMPLKKHKKNLKTYESCFSSSEAVDWLHKNLQKNANFGPDVTREQTIQLLRKLYRAGIIENVKEDVEEMAEFRESGEFYRMSNKSPVKNLRTPGKSDKRTVLGDVANTPRRNLNKENLSDLIEETPKDKSEEKKSENVPEFGVRRRRRDTSRVRKAREEQAKQQLNLSYFQSLPSNSLIILDNDCTWLRVFCRQVESVLSPHHVRLLEQRHLLDMERVTHNMTRVSAKGIVQLEDRSDDLPHWVLSAMKCLANWPRQLKTAGGKESCLPNYPGFEQDVFNVVKDYFLALKEPLTTYPLYEFFVDAWVKAEAVVSMTLATPAPNNKAGCQLHPGSQARPCSRPYTMSSVDGMAGHNQFYAMEDAASDDFLLLSNQERVAKIKQTFSVMPPLATSSVRTADSSNSTMFSSLSNSSCLSPDMSTTAIMRNFLPPNTCFETAFMESSPVTRIVPQAQSETLHLSRSGSGRSLTNIPTGWPTKSTSTQTDSKTESLKRLPKWKRSSRLRKSIAVMEGHVDQMGGLAPTNTPCGMVNHGFATSPSQTGGQTVTQSQETEQNCDKVHLCSASALPSPPPPDGLRLSHSLDNLLEQEQQAKQDFMLKYRQVSGDLRSGQDLVLQARQQGLGRARSQSVGRSSQVMARDNSIIESKTLRKEKRKSRYRDASCESGLSPRLQRVRLDQQPVFYTNPALDSSPEQDPRAVPLRAPLATDELDLSPVPGPILSRQGKYNNSYRLANNQPATPGRALPRTSTRVALVNPQPHLVARAEPYLCTNSDLSETQYTTTKPRLATSTAGLTGHEQPILEPVYTVAGPGPIRRYQAPRTSFAPPNQNRQSHRFRLPSCDPVYALSQTQPLNHCPPLLRTSTHRSSLHSQADSGRSSMGSAPLPPATDMFRLLGLLLPPANRRKLQLLLKFILKISQNKDLSLDTKISNADLSLKTFLDVILRPADMTLVNSDLTTQILQHFLENYEQVWSPSQSLRKEVEEAVYRSLVNKRLEAGEDPYPVTYCEQVTKDQYERAKFTGSQAALMDLLETIIADERMAEKNKKKKLRKFKDSYPEMWRSRFPSTDNEPDYLSTTKKEKSSGKFSSLSRLKSAMGV